MACATLSLYDFTDHARVMMPPPRLTPTMVWLLLGFLGFLGWLLGSWLAGLDGWLVALCVGLCMCVGLCAGQVMREAEAQNAALVRVLGLRLKLEVRALADETKLGYLFTPVQH